MNECVFLNLIVVYSYDYIIYIIIYDISRKYPLISYSSDLNDLNITITANLEIFGQME